MIVKETKLYINIHCIFLDKICLDMYITQLLDATPPQQPEFPIQVPLNFLNPMTFIRTFHHRFTEYLVSITK
jgi:hypothetical protein